MDVFDAPDIEDAVDHHSAAEWLTGYVADQVSIVLGGVDAVIGVEQFDLQNCRVVAAHRHGEGMGAGTSSVFWFG